MKVIFTPRGRLGNAVFRYMACAIICIKYGAEYTTLKNYSNAIINDINFIKIIEHIDKNININLSDLNYLLNDFYQHDNIYLKYKKEIIDFINNSPDHYIITDGVTAGDGNLEKFNVKNLITTPTNFNKYYDIVFHIRLDDHIKANIHFDNKFILNLIDNINFNKYDYSNICIVCQKPNSDYENNYINDILNKLKSKLVNININVESNDIITDFNIIKNCKVLISSISTLCWAASFFSTTIKKCYMPKLIKEKTYTYCSFKTFIENTEFYEIE